MRSRYLTSTAVFYVVVIGFSLLLFCFHRAVYRRARSLFVADSHQVFYPLSPVCRPLKPEYSSWRCLIQVLIMELQTLSTTRALLNPNTPRDATEWEYLLTGPTLRRRPDVPSSL